MFLCRTYDEPIDDDEEWMTVTKQLWPPSLNKSCAFCSWGWMQPQVQTLTFNFEQLCRFSTQPPVVLHPAPQSLHVVGSSRVKGELWCRLPLAVAERLRLLLGLPGVVPLEDGRRGGAGVGHRAGCCPRSRRIFLYGEMDGIRITCNSNNIHGGSFRVWAKLFSYKQWSEVAWLNTHNWDENNNKCKHVWSTKANQGGEQNKNKESNLFRAPVWMWGKG